MEIQKLQEYVKAAENISNMLYANDVSGAQQIIGDTVKNVNNIYLGYINRTDELEGRGIEVPVDILLSQMQNLMTAIDSKDTIMLADTLLYEIKEGMLFFTDIENELGGTQE